MKFAICNELFQGWDFERVCQVTAEVGYDGLELAPFTLAPTITELTASRRQELRAIAADHGLQIVGLHWLLAKTDGYHLTSTDGAVRERTAAYLVALAEACRDLGGQVMVFGSPPQRSLPEEVSPAEGLRAAAEVFGRAMPQIADCGVTLCIEPLSPVETDFVNTCADGVRLVELVDHAAFGLHLDVKAMSSEEQPVTDLIRAHGGTAGHFHANDPNLRGPGFGDVDFVPIFEALREVDYQRWVSVEVFDYDPDPVTIATRSLEYMRSCEQKAALS